MRLIPTWHEVRTGILSPEFGAATLGFIYGSIAVFFTLHAFWAVTH